MQSLTGRSVKGYELGNRIGEGGFGEVYRAFQPVVKREVAIKVILPDYANQPDFIRRFELEAQFIARLEHPHIVPLYDYWRDGGYAYLVMRALRSNLRAAIQKAPWSVEATARLLDQIAGGLAVAHRNGIIHRDIKPDNILLDDENNAYLADFGIAITQEQSAQPFQDDMAIGSLAYVSPEQLRGEALTPQADMYSLGIVLFEVLTGRQPFPSTLTVMSLINKHLNETLPPLHDYRADLPEALNTVIQRATEKNSADRYPDVLAMAAEFQQIARGKPAEVMPSPVSEADLRNPYKGLRAFQEADTGDYFGREMLIQRLLARLAESHEAGRFLAVIGPSGSGKSSVIHAGLLPTLRHGALPGSAAWFMADMRPGPHPFASLEAALQSVAVNPPAEMLAQLRQDEHGLARLVQSVLPGDQAIELLLIIDQFEEVFTLVDDEAECVLFLNSLIAAVAESGNRLRVLIALRADFVDRALQYAGFGELISKHNEFVLPLSSEELQTAIVRPAERVGVHIQPELRAAILSEVGEQPGTLPLLQYALTELFAQQAGNLLTLGTYRANGGVLGTLARQAEDIFASLEPDAQIVARQLFLRLVTLSEGGQDGRRRVGRAELASLAVEQPALDAVIERFGQRRLLTFDHDSATRRPTIEVAHEALIRSWPRLRGWIDASREELLIQRRLLVGAQEWINAGRETSFLADGARLDQFETWAKSTTLALSDEETQYLQASTYERQRRLTLDEARRTREARTAQLAANFQRATIGLGIVGLLALAAIIFLGVRTGNATAEIGRANDLVLTSEGRAALIEQTIAPIPITLTAAAQHLTDSQRTVDQLGLAADADKLLLGSNGNVELAALLSIRALNMSYLPEADTALRQAIEHNYTKYIYTDYPEALYAVAYSPDGKYALTGGGDTTAHLWDVQTGKTIRVFAGHTAAIYGVAFSPDGKYVLTGGADLTARLWSVQTGRTVRTFRTRITPVYQAGHSSPVNSVAFSPDGKEVLTGSRDGSMRLWDVQTGNSILYISTNCGVFGVAFSPDGQYVLDGCDVKHTAALWDAHTGKNINTFVGHTAAVWSVAFSPDGKYVLTGSGDNTARLWDIQSGDSLHVFKGHLSDVTGVSFSPDSKSVLTDSADATARLWDVQSGQLLRIFTSHSGSVWSGAFSPDGKSILTGSDDHTARLWDAQPDLNPFIFASHAAAVWSATFSPDGKSILTGSDDATARLWDVQSKKNILTLSSPKASVYSVAFSPDGKYLLTASNNDSAQLWDAHSGQQVRDFRAFDTSYIYGVAFSPDGKYVATGGVDKTIRLWNTETGQLVLTFTGHTETVNSLAFSPDGKFIVTGSYDHTARVWNTQTGQTIQTLAEHTGTVSGVAYSPDGKFILTGSADNTARLWDAQTGKTVQTYTGHTNAVASVAFSPDGKYVLTGSADSTIRLWDAQTGQVLRVFAGHSNAISSVAFSPDGKEILTASADDTVRLWERDYRDFVAFACTRVTHDFTDDDRLRFRLPDKTPTCPQFAQAATPAATP